MFFINSKINYQAFIENKQLISIKELRLEVLNFEELENNITGQLKITGIGYVNSLDNEEKIEELLTFNIDKSNKKVEELEIDNFTYQIVEGRGLELELDFEIDYEDDSDRTLKEEIVNEVEEKLEEVFIEQESNIIEESPKYDCSPVESNTSISRSNNSKSRRSYRYYSDDDKITRMSNDNGKIFIKRNK